MIDAVFVVDKTIPEEEQIVIFMGMRDEVKDFLVNGMPAKMDRDQIMVSVGATLQRITVEEYLNE